ncbi:uncharacterized protein LOC119458994 [Dermacentor silvarum]|uniref:uncharacterized protein LOC119458994 n=1 Tax=Dermacentor silvarum TaxID=543639 RepID=UPI00189B736F|nr:uncharacterized protein LOC119458994 [Dermacentor silvarum]
MAPLCYRLADIPGLRFSVYADDVTIWTNGGSDGDQSDAIQTGLDTIATFLKEVGLTPSSDKTNFVILGTKAARSASQFSFTFDGEQITQQDSVRVLGIYIDADGGAATWLRNITRTWHQILHLIRRIASKNWGREERTLRRLVAALLISRAVYGFNFYNLTQKQRKKLESLNHEAIRVVTGLPRFTPLHRLGQMAQMNTIEAIAEAAKHSQQFRLRATISGRSILSLLHLPVPSAASALLPCSVGLSPDRDFAPIPQNMNADHAERQLSYARRHEAKVRDAPPHHHAVYTDAALSDEASTVAYYCPRTATAYSSCRPACNDPLTAELAAISALCDAVFKPPFAAFTHHTVYTDSQVSIKACARLDSRNGAVHSTHRAIPIADEAGHTVRLAWVSGHAGVTGNRMADSLARELLSCPSERQSTSA